ncbi:putative Alliin lyase precursor [Tripterygium wilfordii]|uniref:Putative Alliin lyase n=1 Tax=Tripterygium wilfordii TaxID=458696 RepID=A0A7J7CMS0_TRIWF|nr:tryptophan aminotransferase-related protein 4-like [Tripterygium wilfordii]KAF5735331.1 putative Alliin lyase precursor [Tripterygium wilfordii]
MAKNLSSKHMVCLVSSIILNILSIINLYVGGGGWDLSWTRRAATEAEAVAAVYCSGHGRAYLDGLVLDGNLPVCECNSCYGGSDCSQFNLTCIADANGGDPYFLEPFWMQKAASSAVVVAGWHRMGYSYHDKSTISAELERHIRKLHALVGNAVTDGRHILFGAGSTQVLMAAVYALSPLNSSSSPARVVVSIPFYNLYQLQTEVSNSVQFKFEGDTSSWMNYSDYANANFIEFVTAPNNPDGKLNKAVLHSFYTKAIHDRAYYWPHYTGIPAPADDDLMIFTISKLTGHAGSRFGWAVVKDKAVYERMARYMELNTMGVSRDTQLRALKLLKVVLEGGARDLFNFGHETMSSRWVKIRKTVSMSKRFSLQEIPPENCTYFNKIREASPAYAWLKCEREEDKNCYTVLEAANIIGRAGKAFGAEDRYVRLSLLRSQDDFDVTLQHLNKLVLEEGGSKTI